MITWADPADIILGTPLSATQLNAAADVAGSFVYTPPSDTVLGVGPRQTLSVTFTPTEARNYATASATVNINVVYAFSGFLSPLNNPPTFNQARAGSAIPVKFSLNGAQGLNIFLIIKMLQPDRHIGRQIAGIQCTGMCLDCLPWRLGSGNPCRNDGFSG